MFLFAYKYNYNSQEASGIFIFVILYFPSKLGKLKYKYYNVVAIFVQNKLCHEIQDIEINKIQKLKASNLG